MYQAALLCVIIIVNSILGLLVYLKNPKSATNRLFLLLIISIIIWSTVNYFSLHPFLLPQLYWIRLVLFAAAPLCLLVYLTFTVFPAQKIEKESWKIKVALIATFSVMMLTLTPLVFKSVSYQNGEANPTPGPGIVLFVLLVVGLVGAGIWNLVTKLRHSKGHQKEQIRFVLLGLAGMFSLIFITNVLLVVIFSNSSFIALGSAYTLLFSGALAYAIVKHKLFDIRRTVTRGLAYLLSIGFLALTYTVLVFGITSLIVGQDKISRTTQAVYTIIALLLAISFQPIKKFFDKITNRTFYRDVYDSQDVINSINSTLVNTLDLEKLLTSTTKIVESELKVTYADFYLDKAASIEFHLAGSNTKILVTPEWDEFYTYFDDSSQKIFVATHEDIAPRVVELMNSLDIECAIKMTASGEDVGFLLVGPRKSGNLYGNQEIQLLEIIADEVAIAVQNALRFEEISQFNITLQQKIDDATRLLQKSNEKLKQLDEAKDEFISMASHQLRTPLTSVKGYISMVLEGDAGEVNDQQHTFLNQAYVSSQRMVYLIADLLNVSRIKTGKFVVEPKPTYLPDVIESEISQLFETAKSRDLTLVFDKPETFATLSLDETKIRQVIMNFVDNAIYYTPKGGKISIALKQSQNNVEFTVRDTGIGVPQKDQHHLFTKFYRAGNARQARPDGTGLGLFMAKKVVIAQGGAIIFKTQEGKGSTFGFSFPRATLEVE